MSATNGIINLDEQRLARRLAIAESIRYYLRLVNDESEVFHVDQWEDDQTDDDDDEEPRGAGWYWWPCLPGYMPSDEASGPFGSAEEAFEDLREETFERYFEYPSGASWDDVQSVAESMGVWSDLPAGNG